MAWGTLKGFEFRATSGYVTTGANHAFVNDLVVYPTVTTIGGDSVTYGWEALTIGNSRDRTTGSPNAPELSGICFNDGNLPNPSVFRVDLPATGNYSIRIAAGDFSSAQNVLFVVQDTNTALITRTEVATGGADHYIDASLVDRASASAWKAGNVAVTKTFATTIFRYSMASPSSGANVISYIELAQSASSSVLNSFSGRGGGAAQPLVA